MLRIGKKDDDIQIKEILDAGYIDITCVSMWMGVVEKLNYDKIEAAKQIELFIVSLNDNVDDYNKWWYAEYNLNGFD
jgi:tRNA-dihydrouridine synthase